MKACVNCGNAYMVDGEIKCELEHTIPFFDRDEVISNPKEECCNRWEGIGNNNEQG